MAQVLTGVFHFHQGTESHNDIGSELEETIRYFTDGYLMPRNIT